LRLTGHLMTIVSVNAHLPNFVSLFWKWPRRPPRSEMLAMTLNSWGQILTGVHGHNIHVGTLLTLTIRNHAFRSGILIRRSNSSICKCVQIIGSLKLFKSAISCLSVVTRSGKGRSRPTNDGKDGTVLLSGISVCLFILLRFKACVC